MEKEFGKHPTILLFLKADYELYNAALQKTVTNNWRNPMRLGNCIYHCWKRSLGFAYVLPNLQTPFTV